MSKRIVKTKHTTSVETRNCVSEYILTKPRRKADCGVWVDGERIGDVENWQQ